jgi:response regulator NasT
LARKEVSALKETLQIRKKVEQAKGILMKQLGLDEAEAYRSMQKESMRRGIPMKELAQAIIVANQNEI